MNVQSKLNDIINISIELNSIHDIDILLEKILLEARKSVNADAGTIYTIDDAKLVFRHSQNSTLQEKLKKGDKLIYKTFSIPVNSSSIAGYSAFNGVILNIKNVYEISEGQEYRFDSHFDTKADYKTISMLTVPLKSDDGEVMGVIQIINSKDRNGEIVPFNNDDELFIQYFASIASVAMQKARMTRTLIMRMIRMAELRDPKETGAHVNRVAAYSVEIYERWAVDKGIPRTEIDKNRDILRMAAMLHDVGKVGISDNILKKPARFTAEEYDIMKTHTTLGSELFINKESEFDKAAANIAVAHHENWDGSGYPQQEKNSEISLFGRIVALADVYDALSCKRVYKEAWKEDDVLNEIKKLSGIKFDPEIVDAFFKSLDIIRAISEKYPDDK